MGRKKKQKSERRADLRTREAVTKMFGNEILSENQRKQMRKLLKDAEKHGIDLIHSVIKHQR